MAMTAEDYLEPLLNVLVPVAAIQTGVCRICRSAPNDNYDTCYPCRESNMPVLPITMSIHQGQIHHHLRNYKNGPTEESREKMRMSLAALLEIFLRNHLSCIGGDFQRVATVPSAVRDAPWDIIQTLNRFQGHHNPLRITNGSLTTDPDVAGDRILLLDDTFTTGASIFNAARVLRQQGATVVAVVLGRHIRPDWTPSQPLLAALRQHRWDATRCGLCNGVQCPELTPTPGTLM